MEQETPEMGDDDKQEGEPLDAAFAAYLRSCDSGTAADREAFVAQFPELADELRRLIATADMLQSFTMGPPSASQSPPTGIAGRSLVSRGAMVSRGTGAAGPSVGDGPQPQTLAQFDGNETLPIDDRPSDHPGPRLPFVLGDYHLERMLGRGGMGVVYLATQRGLDRLVAVKMIRSGVFAGDDEVRRFRSEAKAAARLKHPNIVTVHHFGFLEGHHYFSMDFVPGTDLARKLAAGPLSIAECARYVRDCARAIHYAHQQGILHRDLKPANVLIDEQDQVRITDFGLAKHADNDSSVTASGTAVGTPNYMSPEQAGGHGDRATRTADVYSLGAILFALLTGRPPFQAGSVVQTLMEVIHSPIPSPRELRPELPHDLETVVYKCLEKEPKKRYATALDLADDLDRFLEGRPVEAKARSTAMRIWYWFCDVPIVAALTGRRFLNASQSHRRFQTTILAMVLFAPVAIFAMFALSRWSRAQMPSFVQIAGGLTGGVYDELSGELAYRISRSQGVDATVVSTDGSLDNRQRLLAGQVHLAPMQFSAIRGEDLCVVAPLLYEAVHVLVRNDLPFNSLDDLRQCRVAVGPEGSGSRIAADLLFDSYQLAPDEIKTVVTAWTNVEELRQVDAAIICIGTGSDLVRRLITQERFKLVPIEDSLQVSLDHPTLRPLEIRPEDYPEAAMPSEGYATVGMTAFLATRLDAPDILVNAALDAIYTDPPLVKGMIPRRGASEYLGMRLHPAARVFFDQ
jgi:TRAP transporter TAXI family solute receptor